jgi:anti-anti-sigma factor
MIPSSAMLAAYAAGVVLAVALAVSIRKGFLRTPGSLRVSLGFSAAFFAALAIASVVARWYAPYTSWDRLLYGLCTPLFACAAFVAFALVSSLGRLNRSVESSVASLASIPGASVKAAKPMIGFRVSIKPRGDQLAQNESMRQGVGGTQSRVAFAPKGELNAQSLAIFQQVIEKACANGPREIVVDLTNVSSLDSAAADAIMQSCRRFSDSQFRIIAPTGSAAERALKQLDPTIPIEPTLSAGDPLDDAIERAESRIEAQDSAPSSNASTWKGF